MACRNCRCTRKAGSGKSTLAREVVRRVNQRLKDTAVVVPMDGFHLYRWQLDQFPDPQNAHFRRGAPWTFDPQKLLHLLKKIKSEGNAKAPSFDHSAKDPKEDDIEIRKTYCFCPVVPSTVSLSSLLNFAHFDAEIKLLLWKDFICFCNFPCGSPFVRCLMNGGSLTAVWILPCAVLKFAIRLKSASLRLLVVYAFKETIC